MALTRENIYEALRQCFDPEIPVNIVDLGLVYDVAVNDEGGVRVKMTLTSQGCPAAQSIPDNVKAKVGAVPEVRDVAVDVVWEPAWNPSMISAAAKQQLGIDV
jgi:FeS assembly SUF system protein